MRRKNLKMREYLENYFKELRFEEKTHRYTYGETPIRDSVSSLLKYFSTPFRKDEISAAVAKKRGVTPEEIIQEWDELARVACEHGNKVHGYAEDYFHNQSSPKDPFEEAIVKFYEVLPPHVEPILAEYQMVHKEYLFAGTSDLILHNTASDTYIIADYKTNKDLFKNYKGTCLQGPFSALRDTPFNKYQLQLSFYQILLEQCGNEEYPIQVSSRKIIWITASHEVMVYDTEDYTPLLREWLEKEYCHEDY